MPHDKNGAPLKEGDTVTVTFTVTGVSPGEEYCNLTCSTVEPMFPGNHKTSVTFNAKQVVKCGDSPPPT